MIRIDIDEKYIEECLRFRGDESYALHLASHVANQYTEQFGVSNG